MRYFMNPRKRFLVSLNANFYDETVKKMGCKEPSKRSGTK